MKKKFKGILAFLMSIIICFSVFPVSSYAKTTSFDTFEVGAYGNKVSAEPNQNVSFPYRLSSTKLQSEFDEYYVNVLNSFQVSDGILLL